MSASNQAAKQEVVLHMEDWITGEKITRAIDISNIFVDDRTAPLDCEGMCIATDDKQIRKCLENWILQRGNQQHNAHLSLLSYEIK